MKPKTSLLLWSSLTLLVVAALGAEEKSPAKAAPAAPYPAPAATGPGLLNDWLRQQSPQFKSWDIGGQVRVRFEHKEHFAAPGQAGAVDFRRTGGNSDNTYWLLREKFHVGYTPCPWFSVYAEARDSSSQGDDRDPNPEADSLDLHQGFFTLGNAKEFPLTAKLGRQELNYGDERLIGGFDWNNVGRVFDAAKLRYEDRHVWVDGFIGRVILPDDNTFNEANDYDLFSGLYASSRTLCPKQETQFYFLARNVGLGSPTAIGAGLPPLLMGASPRDIYTIGMRVKSLPGQLGNWDYDAELAGQFGRFKFAAAGPALTHEAFAAHVAGGYTWTKAWGTPRVGLEYNYASGDGNASDGRHETFENLFPTNHKFYGYMDFVSWQNIHNVRLATSLKPHKKFTLTLDGHLFWLAQTEDAFYQVNGLARGAPYALSRHHSYVGSEIDLIATYALRPYATLQAGYGHFFVGSYVKSSLAGSGGATDADYVYLQTIFNF
jgi:hypothetical protein